MNLETRVANLERRCRFYRSLFLLMGMALLALIAIGAARPGLPVIQARRFEVIGPQGQKVVTLHHTEDGSGGLTIFNRRGRPIIQAGINRRGHGVLEVLNSAGKPVLDVYSGKSGKGIVQVCDPAQFSTARPACRNLAGGPWISVEAGAGSP